LPYSLTTKGRLGFSDVADVDVSALEELFTLRVSVQLRRPHQDLMIELTSGEVRNLLTSLGRLSGDNALGTSVTFFANGGSAETSYIQHQHFVLQDVTGHGHRSVGNDRGLARVQLRGLVSAHQVAPCEIVHCSHVNSPESDKGL